MPTYPDIQTPGPRRRTPARPADGPTLWDLAAGGRDDLPPAEPTPRLVYRGDVPTHRHARPTEAAAAERMADFAPTLRVEVLAEIRSRGDAGVTDKELGRWHAARLGLPPNDGTARYTVAPRRVELLHAGFVAATDRVRERCTVWIATPQEGVGRLCPRAKASRKVPLSTN